MDAQLLRRPLAAALSTACRVSLPSTTTTLRHSSSSRRTRKMLNIKPHPSFLNDNPLHPKAPTHTRPTSFPTQPIIFNPPSSAPSVYHTPFAFLPKTDPRRRAQMGDALFTQSTTLSFPASPTTPKDPTDTSDLPPIDGGRPEDHKKPAYHLTREDIDTIRRMRLEAPMKNTVAKLAQKFGCSRLFIMMVTSSPREHRDWHKTKVEAVKARWGPKKAAAREERARRFDMLFNGEI